MIPSEYICAITCPDIKNLCILPTRLKCSSLANNFASYTSVYIPIMPLLICLVCPAFFFPMRELLLGNPLQCKDSCGSRSECSVFYRTFWRGAAERPVSLPALTAATVPSHLAETPMVLPRANSATSWNCHYRETLVLCQSCPPPLLTSPAVVCELIVILQEPPPWQYTVDVISCLLIRASISSRDGTNSLHLVFFRDS